MNGLMLLAEKGKPGEVYNLSSEHCYQMKDIVTMIEEQIGHKIEIKVDPKLLRPTDERIIIGNVEKLKRDTGWSQKIPMSFSIGWTIDFIAGVQKKRPNG